MDHIGIILVLVTLVTCFQPVLTLSQRLKTLQRLSNISSDFFQNRVRAGGLREQLDQNAELKIQQGNVTTNGTLITSMAFENLPQPTNDLISKQYSNQFAFRGMSMFSQPNVAKLPPPPTQRTTFMRPGLKKDILSMFNTPVKKERTGVLNSGSGQPVPGVVKKEIDRAFVTSGTPASPASPVDKQGPLSIYNTPINFKPVDQIPAYDNEIESKKNSPSQTTVKVKTSDPAPPTTPVKRFVSVEKLISKQDELFALILQYHTEVNKLITDILAKLNEPGA